MFLLLSHGCNLVEDRSDELSLINCDLKSSQSRAIELCLDADTRGREWITRISAEIYPSSVLCHCVSEAAGGLVHFSVRGRRICHTHTHTYTHTHTHTHTHILIVRFADLRQSKGIFAWKFGRGYFAYTIQDGQSDLGLRCSLHWSTNCSWSFFWQLECRV